MYDNAREYNAPSNLMSMSAAKMAGLYEPPTPASVNNGGSTDYYKLDPLWQDLQDIIEAHNLNFAQGNILKAAFTFNVGRHDATNYERELNKIIWFAQRELNQQKGNI